MRKRALALSVLTVILLGLAASAFFHAHAETNDPIVCREIFTGTPDAAAGLSMSWAVAAGRSGGIQTAEFKEDGTVTSRFAADPEAVTSPDPQNLITIEINWQQTSLPYELIERIQEGFRKDPAAGDITVSIPLREIAEYQPVSVSLSALEEKLSKEGRPTFRIPSEGAEKLAVYSAQETIADFFTIPVPETAAAEAYQKNKYTGMEVRIENGYRETISGGHFLLTEEGAYFDLKDPADRHGEPLDYSLIPGGFGLYLLPMTPEGLDADALQLFYALEEGEHLLFLKESTDKSALLLFLRNDSGKLYVRKVRRSDGCVTETLPVMEYEPQAECIVRVLKADGCCVIHAVTEAQGQRSSRLFILEEKDALALTELPFAQFGPQETEYFAPAAAAWDGKELAIPYVCYEYGRDANRFRLAIYDRNGLKYLADYESRLARGDAALNAFRAELAEQEEQEGTLPSWESIRPYADYTFAVMDSTLKIRWK